MSDYRDDRTYGREPDDEDYYTYDATDEEDEGRKRPLVVLAIIALLVIFAGVVFFAYKQGLREGADNNPPLIRADQGPVKRAPENPGGMEIPHQDKTIYERLSGSNQTTQSDAEHLLPRAEEPMQVRKPEAPAAQTPAISPQVTSPTVPDTDIPASGAVAVPTAPVAAAPVAEVPVAEVPGATPAPADAAGGYVIQLAALRDEAAAQSEFKKLQGKHPQLASLSADIEKADLGAKGIYYRLRAGYLDKANAQTACTELKAAGVSCLVKPR